MTYTEQLAAVGSAADQQVTDLAGQLAGADVQVQQLQAQVAQLQAQLAAIPPAAPAADMIVGTSAPGWPTLGGRMVRTYEGGVPASYATSAAAKVTGVRLHASLKVPPGTLASSATTRAQVAQWLAGLPGGAVTDQHEPENPSKAIDPAAYRGDWPYLLDLIDVENQGRAGDRLLEGVPVFMAYSLTAAAAKRDIPGQWLPTDPRIRTVGFDCYTTAELHLAHDLAVGLGLQWAVPEYGFVAGTNATAPTDLAYLARVRADVALLRSLPRPPRWLLLWDQGVDSVASDPLTAAYWQGLSA